MNIEVLMEKLYVGENGMLRGKIFLNPYSISSVQQCPVSGHVVCFTYTGVGLPVIIHNGGGMYKYLLGGSHLK